MVWVVIGVSLVLIAIMGVAARRIQGGRRSYYGEYTVDHEYEKIQRRRETMDDGFGGALGGPRPPDSPADGQTDQASDR